MPGHSLQTLFVDGPKHAEEPPVEILCHAGGIIKLEAIHTNPSFRPMIGQDPDSFLVSLAISAYHDNSARFRSRYTGFRELDAALWGTKQTSPCDHPKSIRKPSKLPTNCIATSGENTRCQHIEERVIVCLTAGNPAARWRALVSLASRRDAARENGNQEPTMVRKEDCCYNCAVDQCLQLQGKWFLIL